MYYTVTYSGPFGFIKPWTAVRDELTFSQQFLTPSILEGMRQKLEVSGIARHKLSYDGTDKQQEQTRPKLIKKWKKNFGILSRGVLLNPRLTLAFERQDDAQIASRQHICLIRNEDVLLPASQVIELQDQEFNRLEGFELKPATEDEGFLVGYNRFDQDRPMYGKLEITGNPLGRPTL